MTARVPTRRSGAAALALALAWPLLGCGAEPPGDDGPAPSAEEQLPDVLAAKLAEHGVEAVVGEGELAPELRDDSSTLPDPEAWPGAAETGAGGGASAPPAGEDAERAPTRDAGAPTDAQPEGNAPTRPTTPEDPDLNLPPGTVQLRDDLVEMVLSRPRMLSLALVDVEDGGGEMVRAIAAGLRDPSRSPAELRVLVDLAKTEPSAEVARALERVATFAPDAALRGYAASAIIDHLDAEGADAVLPGLVKRKKYERAEGVLRWVDETVAAIRGRLAAGAEPSPALLGELWRLVSKLSGEHFQLRGVDDARFILARLGPWAARELGDALGDRDPYVRLHTAQVLERMGADGAPAAAALQRALGDPDGGVAGAAAEALSVVVAGAGDPALAEAAENALLAQLDANPPYEIRVALVRALSKLPDGGPAERLRALFDGAPTSDMRLAAAEGLLASDAHRPAALAWLADELEARVGDPGGAEALLEDWLRGGGGPGGLLEAWLTHAPPAEVIHTAEQARARRAARAALVRERAL